MNLAGPDKVMVTSFTRAAAREIATRARDIDINPDNVGTLHAICYRALGNPKLTADHIDDWNTAHPDMALQNSTISLDESILEHGTPYGKGGAV